MSSYTLAWDDATKILTLRVVGFMSDSEAEEMVADMLRMTQMARRERGVLRFLFDNRQGAVFPPGAAAALETLKSTLTPGDRSAVLVSGALNKLQANRAKSELTEVFMSEEGAVAWLKE